MHVYVDVYGLPGFGAFAVVQTICRTRSWINVKTGDFKEAEDDLYEWARKLCLDQQLIPMELRATDLPFPYNLCVAEEAA